MTAILPNRRQPDSSPEFQSQGIFVLKFKPTGARGPSVDLAYPRMTSLLRTALVPLFALALAGCGADASDKTFVGKWKSSKLETPIHIRADGEWELDGAGAAVTYGVWHYAEADNLLVWSYLIQGEPRHETNRLLSHTATEFKLLELNGATTTFKRLD